MDPNSGAKSPQPAPPEPDDPDEAEVRLALHDVALSGARSLSVWLAALFALFVVSDALLYPPPANAVFPVYDAVLAALFLGAWLAIRRGRVGGRHGHTASGGILAVILPYLIAILWVTGQPLQSAGLALWQVATGVFLLSWPWTLALLAASDVAWGAAVLRLPNSPEWPQYAILLVSANVLALVAHGVRLGAYRRLEGLRVRDRRRQQELERALAEARQAQELRRVNEMRTRFMNVAAHELATPLTPLLIQVRLLRSLAAQMQPDARKAVGILDRSLARLNGLVRDILDGSRLQSDRLPLALADVDLAALLREAVDAYAPAAEQAGVTLVLGEAPPATLRADGKRLHQVLGNFLNNAMKFTPPGGTVRVRAAVEGRQVRVEVSDDGLGFPADQVANLFQPFSQLHEAVPGRQGSGLGLYITRGIVERHGGSVGAHSAGPGQGARFWALLPLAPPEAATTVPTADPASTGG
jgi:signal transduction histidine kinase